MNSNNDEIKYKELIKTLGNLQKVNAPANFDEELRKKITNEGYQPTKSFWDKIFIPSKLIPSAGLAAAALIVFFVITVNSEEMDDPFLIEPRIREDVYAIESTGLLDNVEKVEEKTDDKAVGDRKSSFKEENLKLEKKELSGRDKSVMREDFNDEVTEGQIIVESEINEIDSVTGDLLSAPTSMETRSEMATGLAITKDELNFRQVQLNEQEQKVVNQLKQKVQVESQEKKKIE